MNEQNTETMRDEPLLGLATTRELLAEVEARMRIDPRGWDFLASVCRDGLDLLPDDVLGYRTAEPQVDHNAKNHPQCGDASCPDRS